MPFKDDWCSNARWGDAEEQQFFQRLARTRLKGRYVRLKAGVLSKARDPVRIHAAIDLLERVLEEWPDPYLGSSDHHDIARCYDLLGDYERAIEHCRISLKLQEQGGCAHTYAHVDFLLLFLRHASRLQDEAMRVIENRGHEMRNGSYMERFVLRAARAVLRFEKGDKTRAGVDAAWALNAASRQHSGLDRYPELGLVKDVDDILKRVRQISEAAEEKP